jgi:hypothetical protein
LRKVTDRKKKETGRMSARRKRRTKETSTTMEKYIYKKKKDKEEFWNIPTQMLQDGQVNLKNEANELVDKEIREAVIKKAEEVEKKVCEIKENSEKKF